MLQRLSVALLSVATLCACDNTAPTPVRAPLETPAPLPVLSPLTARFVDDLHRAGAPVGAAEILSEAAYPWIRVPAVRISIGEERVAAFEYPTTEEVEAALRHTSADGHEFASAQVSWVSDPHIYRSDRLIVLYVGTSRPLLDLLRRVLGPQVAGR